MQATRIRLDIAKNVFQVHGVDAPGVAIGNINNATSTFLN